MSDPAGPRPTLPERAADTSAEQPWPVRLLSVKVGEYIDRMSVCWVEGQVVQLTRRPGSGTAYLTLRDTDVDMSFSVAIRTTALDAMPPLQPGARVVTQVKPVFWPRGGSLQLDARQIRPVGIGELLARLEALKTLLASEGLFDARRKRPLPFLPRRIGLITGRASAAEKDVVENARRRWPSATFEMRAVAVQGPTAVTEVCAALRDLDAHDEVDVIVIARGGGSTEDLLPFSNEAMIRAVSQARTPVVSAIGHDIDTPSSTSSPTRVRQPRRTPPNSSCRMRALSMPGWSPPATDFIARSGRGCTASATGCIRSGRVRSWPTWARTPAPRER